MPNEPAPRHGRARMYPWLYAIVGGAWIAAHVTGLLGGVAQYTFVLLTLSSMVATVIGVRSFRPSHRWPFVVILGGFFLFVAGGAARQSMSTIGNLTSSRSIVPDALTLPGYVLLGLGLLGFAYARRGGFDFDSLLDALLVALAALAFVWSYLIAPALQHEHAPLKVRLVLVCYPAMSVFMVAIVMQIVSAGGKGRPLAQRLLLVALSMMVIGDVIYMFVDSRIATLPGGLLDLPYALAFLAFGTGVLHPSMRELCEPVASSERAPTKARLALVSIALGLPVVVILSKLPKNTGDRVALVIISLVPHLGRDPAACSARCAARPVGGAAHRAGDHDALPVCRIASWYSSGSRGCSGSGTRVTARSRCCFVDVDRFKLVNDSSARRSATSSSSRSRERLRTETPPGSLIGRVGGDEFVVVIRNLSTVSTVTRAVAEHLRRVSPHRSISRTARST